MTSQSSNEFYHVDASPAADTYSVSQHEWEFNLSKDQLEQRILGPYRKAKPMVVRGRVIQNDGSYRVRIFRTHHRVNDVIALQNSAITEATSELVGVPPGSEVESGIEPLVLPSRPSDIRKVFVVHGKNIAARDAMFEFLSSIDLRPLEWNQAVQLTAKPTPYIGEILDAAFSEAQAILVLMTPDDEARLREQFQNNGDPGHETSLTGQARPNVLFEAGMAMGRDPNRTILVELGTLRPFSDVGGRHVIRLDGSSQRRQELAQRLEAAGCPVDLSGTTWHTAGEFDAVLEAIIQLGELTQPDSDQSTESLAFTALSVEALELLKEAANDPTPLVLTTRTRGGLNVQANGKQFVESNNPRSEARWKQALSDLAERGLVEDEKGKGEVFWVTQRGFEMVDRL